MYNSEYSLNAFTDYLLMDFYNLEYNIKLKQGVTFVYYNKLCQLIVFRITESLQKF